MTPATGVFRDDEDVLFGDFDGAIDRLRGGAGADTFVLYEISIPTPPWFTDSPDEICEDETPDDNVVRMMVEPTP